MSESRSSFPAVLDVSGEMMTLMFDGRTVDAWNHDLPAIQELIEKLGPRCDWFPSLNLARLARHGNRHRWVNLSTDQETSPCVFRE
jgi:hypothetical protein